ncbi:MAG: hypothetical protein M1834_009366 [Cirrosporium novae-zelandiae]|nr:MAG: hypothetical protein M1834_009366 [Cirrosporium novae-zelandiae]
MPTIEESAVNNTENGSAIGDDSDGSLTMSLNSEDGGRRFESGRRYYQDRIRFLLTPITFLTASLRPNPDRYHAYHAGQYDMPNDDQEQERLDRQYYVMIEVLSGKLQASLPNVNVLHRDISTGNILLNEAEDDGFLIDLDLAIEADRKKVSGALSKTGTKIFMAIGAFDGEQHNFIHDLKSFF